MPFAKIHPSAPTVVVDEVPDGIGEYNTKADAALNNKAYLLPMTEVDKDYNPATQKRTGPVYTVNADDVVATYTVTNKSRAELDAEADASELNAEDVDRLLRGQGVTRTEINQAKRDRGTPRP